MSEVDFDWGEIPDSNVLPDGVYELQIESLEDTTSGSGKRMFKCCLRVTEPKEWANHPHFENFVIGSDDDPDGAQPETRKRSLGAITLKKMLSKAGVPLDRMVCQNAVGQRVVCNIIQTIETKEGQYKGQARNKITRWYAAGEAATGTSTQPTPPLAAQPPKARGAAGRPNEPTPPATPAPGVGVSPRPAPAPRSGNVPCGACGAIVISTLLPKHQAEECPARNHAAGLASQAGSSV